MTTYRWRSGSERTGGDVQAIGQRLAELVESHGDRLKAQIIVDAARPKESPLHTLFTWDDKYAAELYRREEARNMLRKIEVVIDGEEPQRMFINVVETISEDEEERAYVTTARVLSDAVLTRQVLARAYDEMRTFREKYGHFKELAKVADAAQSEIGLLMEEKAEIAVA